MTKDDIIRMAQECQLIGMRPHLDGIYQESLERFAVLVAAAEREACAKICETLWDTPTNGMATEEESYGNQCAAAIRARSNTVPASDTSQERVDETVKQRHEQEPVAYEPVWDSGPTNKDMEDAMIYTFTPQPVVNKSLTTEQEPAVWGVDWGPDGNSVSIIKRLADGSIEVVGHEYAPHSPQRTWQGLTDEELSEVYNRTEWDMVNGWEYERAIEAKLKEKNHAA